MQPHLKITSDLISPFVVLPGDPARVDVIGTYLNNFKIIANNREFRTGIGTYKNLPITVCSTGIGCPSTAVAVEELISAGAKYLVRIGTCGGAWRQDIPAGTVIIPTASIRDEGTTIEYIPSTFPAVADLDIVTALRDSAKQTTTPYRIGINRTHDAFYGSERSITRWGDYLNDPRWENIDTPIISSEMESSALFIVASLRGVKAGAIFAANADPEPLKSRLNKEKILTTTEKNKEVTQETINKTIVIALEALLKLK